MTRQTLLFTTQFNIHRTQSQRDGLNFPGAAASSDGVYPWGDVQGIAIEDKLGPEEKDFLLPGFP